MIEVDNNARYIDGHLIVNMIYSNSKYECFQALINDESSGEKKTVLIKLFTSENAFEDEFAEQEKLIHSNITSMIAYKRQGTYLDSGGLRLSPYIMMEHFDFEIFNFISSKQKPSLTEGVVWYLFKQIISAVQKYEEADIKDIYLNLLDMSKLVMLDTKTKQIKLPDIFSETYILKKSASVSKVKGLNNYNIPPELSPCKLVNDNIRSLFLKDKPECKLGGGCSSTPIVYSTGILLFNLATGNGFNFKSIPPLFNTIYDKNTRSKKLWSSLLNQQKTSFTLSDSIKDLIEKMLDYNPSTRISLQEIMIHSWYTTSQILEEEFIEFCNHRVEGIIQELIEYDASEAYKLRSINDCCITRSDNYRIGSSCKPGSNNLDTSEDYFKEGKFDIYSHYKYHKQLIQLKLQNFKSSNMNSLVYELVKSALKYEGVDFYRGSNSTLECMKNMRQSDYLISESEDDSINNEQTPNTIFKFKCELYFDVNDLQYTIILLAEDNPHYLWDVYEGIKNELYRAKS